MFGNLYLNLDDGLQNYFFEWNFGENLYSGEQYWGYWMNWEEDIYLFGKSRKIVKEIYLEVETLSNYLKNPKYLRKDNITLDRIRFQIDGKTTLHYFCLDSKMLSKILEIYSKEWKDYLTSILMKNTDGESPLDIALKNNFT